MYRQEAVSAVLMGWNKAVLHFLNIFYILCPESKAIEGKDTVKAGL